MIKRESLFYAKRVVIEHLWKLIPKISCFFFPRETFSLRDFVPVKYIGSNTKGDLNFKGKNNLSDLKTLFSTWDS